MGVTTALSIALMVAAQAPAADYDEDGIPNVEDDCPTDAGRPENKGCPGQVQVAVEVDVDPKLARIDGGRILLGEPILFKTGSARISPRSAPLLDAVATLVEAVPREQRVIVRGHTDSVGRRTSNMALSRRRAAAVVAALVQRGIPAERLASEGMGPDLPIADNDTAAGRARNRRVDFVVVDAR